MRIIKDGFQALDAMEYAAKEGYTFIVKANTITGKEKFMPKMRKFQIRTKGIDSDTLDYIKSKYLTVTK